MLYQLEIITDFYVQPYDEEHLTQIGGNFRKGCVTGYLQEK